MKLVQERAARPPADASRGGWDQRRCGPDSRRGAVRSLLGQRGARSLLSYRRRTRLRPTKDLANGADHCNLVMTLLVVISAL